MTTAALTQPTELASVLDAIARAVNLPYLLGRATARITPSVVNVRVLGPEGHVSGAGIALTAVGHVLTCEHVIRDVASESVRVIAPGAIGREAVVLATDRGVDAAVLLASPGPPLVPAVVGDSDAVRVGDAVVVVGSPSGRRPNAVSGTVAALRELVITREDDDAVPYAAFRCDAATGPGFSGGAVVNLRGEVVGLHVAGRHGSDGHQSFAIPINDVRPLITRVVPRG